MATGDAPAYRRVLLVGFMGSGKTAVGRALATLLGWEFSDFDAEVEARVGLSVTRIFRERGEAFFREAEALVASELLLRERAVLAAGGGWPAVPGRMESAGPDTLTVWLRVPVEEAVRRVRAGGATRPLLLSVPDPVAEARTLLARREPFYARAHVTLEAAASPPDALARMVRRHLMGAVPDASSTSP